MKLNGWTINVAAIIQIATMLIAVGILYERVNALAQSQEETASAINANASRIAFHEALQGHPVALERTANVQEQLREIKAALARIERQTK